MKISTVVILAMGAVVMFLTGALLTEDVLRWENNAIAADKAALSAILSECNYSPHPIADVSWEMYRQKLIPLGTAGYYTGIVKSVNGPAVKCLRDVLPEQWAAPGGP